MFPQIFIDISKLAQQFVYDKDAPMIFSSGIFMWLFLGFLCIYALLKKHDTGRIIFVILFSYYFYYKSSGTYFFLLMIVTVCDYLFAHFMSKTENNGRRKLFVILSLCVNLGLLCYFKYTNFFGQIFSDIFGDGNFKPFDIFLPVGISFFTFQSLSYTIDVYRKNIQPLDNIIDYAFYVSFFPQLVAGPIVRARDFIPQIRRPLCVTKEMIGVGLWFIICGLFKKAVISDYISVNFVERVFAAPDLYSGFENLMGLYGYALQIYCDFSGYSDMAIGIALLLGFHFNKNFDSPYKSASITEFWRRWHISLSSWLRDYLYISLGGNRKGKTRQCVNLFITMFLAGLWHGAAMNFVLWGAAHGIAMVLHRVLMNIKHRPKGYEPTGFRRFLGILVTFHFTTLAWILFRNSTMDAAGSMVNQICNSFHHEFVWQFIAGYWQVCALIALGFILHFLPEKFENRCKQIFVNTPFIVKIIAVIIVIFIVIQTKSSDIQPFIYFQF